MVGRLVQQQHVRLAPGDQCERKAGALAAGKPIDRLERAIASKIPAAEEIAEILGRFVRRNIAQVIERTLTRLQRLHRVLREISQLQIRMRAAFAGQ